MFEKIIEDVQSLDEVSLIKAFEEESDPLKKDLFQAFLDYNGRMRQREVIKKGLLSKLGINFSVKLHKIIT